MSDPIILNALNGLMPNYSKTPVFKGGRDPKVDTNTDISTDYNIVSQDWWPTATIVSVCFIFVWFIIITVLKIMFTSTDEFMNNNKYDLILFKPTNQTKNSAFVGRKMFENNAVNQHNLKAELEAGFELDRPAKSNMMRRQSEFSNGDIATSSNYIPNGNLAKK